MNRPQLLGRVAAAAVLIALISGGVGVTPSDAGGPLPLTPIACGETITESIRVANDLSCADPGTVLTITGAGVTVDLNGHTVAQTTPKPCYLPAWPLALTCGVAVGGGATLANGTLSTTLGLTDGTATRIRVNQDVSINDGAFHRGMVTDAIVSGTSARITRNHLLRTTIVLDDTFTHLTFSIRDNVIQDSDATPWNSAGPERAAIEIWGKHPFVDEVNGDIVNNTIFGSAAHGIAYVGGGPNVGDLEIRGNLLVANAQSGLFVKTYAWSPPVGSGGPLTIRKNLAVFNGGHGIEVYDDGLDVAASHNFALVNALNPQCMGITC